MKIIYLKDIQNPLKVIHIMRGVYSSMVVASKRENDLKSFVRSSVMVHSLDRAEDMHERSLPKNGVYYYYSGEPMFHYVEESDSLEEVLDLLYSFNGCVPRG